MACALIPLYFPTLGYDAIDTKLSLCALLSHGRHRSLPTAKSMKISPFHEILHGFGWQPSTKLFANIFTLNVIPDFIPVHLEHSANKKLLLWVWLLAHRSQPKLSSRVYAGGIKKVFAIHGAAWLVCGWGRKNIAVWLAVCKGDGKFRILLAGILLCRWEIFFCKNANSSFMQLQFWKFRLPFVEQNFLEKGNF